MNRHRELTVVVSDRLRAAGWALVPGHKRSYVVRLVAVALTLALLLGVPMTGSAQSYAIQGLDHYFRVESQTGNGRRGPVVSGYVHNLTGHTADRVRLAIETVDAAGQVTGSSFGQVVGTVPPHGYAYFEVPVRQSGNYRVRVLSFDPVGRGQ